MDRCSAVVDCFLSLAFSILLESWSTGVITDVTVVLVVHDTPKEEIDEI